MSLIIDVFGRKRLDLAWATAIVILCAGQARATDNGTLAFILTRAFLAQNFVMYCSQFNPYILGKAQSQQGNISSLVNHIRAEVISGLRETEAESVILRSADAARTGSLLAIRQFYEVPPKLQRQRISEWCERSIQVDVTKYIEDHDQDHDLFLKEIFEAKERQNI